MSMPNTLALTLVPGRSFLHRLNPLAKLAWLVGLVVISFSTQNIVLIYVLTLVVLLIGLTSGIARPLLKALTILIPLGGSLIFIQAVAPATAPPWVALASFGPFTIYQEGVYSGLLLFGRIAVGLIAAFSLVMTTHQNDLFASLAKIKVPYILNFMMAMTLQLLPLFQREVGIIMSAQKSRGMKGRGFAAVLPSFIPVFVGAIERVQQLAISLESRGFGSQGNRTSYRRLTVRPVDWAVGILAGVATAALVTMSIATGGGSLVRSLQFSPTFAIVITIVGAVGFLGTIAYVVYLGLRK